MIEFGSSLAKKHPKPIIIYLVGNLGTGKTTFTKGFLQGLGFTGNVKSPTFTIVETYTVNNNILHHFDLYRIEEADELEYVGIADYFDGSSYVFIEWPQKGGYLLPKPDLSIEIKYNGDGRELIINK